MNISCSAEPCPVILDCSCVFYSGANLIYTGIVTNDTLCTSLAKIDQKFKDAAIGYVFQNGIIQAVPGGPVKLGGTLNQNTVITSGGYTFALTGTIESSAFITTGGTSSQFVKGDGSLDSTSYQPAGNYISALTGDGTATGPGSVPFTLATTGVLPNTYGSSTDIPILTIDSKGRITWATSVPFAVPPALLLFSGDVTGAGYSNTTIPLTLATVLSTPGTYGGATTIPVVTVNAKGLVTGITQVPFTSGSVTAVTASSPLFSSGGNTPNITIQQSSGSQDGYLSSTDWTTFNNKVGGSGVATRVAFWDTSSSISSDSVLYWDNTNKRLGVGISTPQVRLHVGNGGGVMGFPYEEAIVEKTGDTKFGVYTSTTSPTSGGASYTFGYTNFLTNAGYYPGFEYQMVGDAIDADNKVRFNFLQRNLAGIVISNSIDLLDIYASGRVVLNPTSPSLSPVPQFLLGLNTSAYAVDIESTLSSRISKLGGGGTQMVIVDNNGVLGVQTISSGTVTGVTATSPITSSGGTAPVISTSMATNRLIGRTTVGVGVMEEITVGTGLSLSGGTLSSTVTGTVTSVDLTMPSAFNVTGNPVTTSGTLAVTGAGTVSQYVRGDGTLANFPNSTGGGASVNYYLNGSVSQGTFGGDTYYEMSKTPVLGAGTNFIRTNGSGNGYIASFITDAGDPNQLNIPGGNWNLEFYFNSSASGGTPSFYAELYKVDVTNAFTLIASGSANPEGITNGTAVDQYFTSLPVPQTTLLATDRLAIRIFVTTGGRTLTLHTENSNLAEVLTTFTTGLTALNGLTEQVQNFAVGTSGTDFNISSATATHTFNLPTASATNRGALSTTDWTNFDTAYTNRITSLTTTGTSGAATLVGNTLNIPQYAGATVGGSTGNIQYNNGTTFAGSNNLFWDNTNTRFGIAQSTPTSRFHLNFNQNSVTQSDANGILLANTSAAIAGTQSISPALVWQGNGWQTTTSASQDVRFRADVLPVQGTTNPSATWTLASSINGAAYVNRYQASSAGTHTFYDANGTSLLTLNNTGTITMGNGQISSLASITASTQFKSGSATATAAYRTTNAGSNVTPTAFFGASETNTAGTLAYATDVTNGFSFTAANGTRQIARAAINITNLTNTAGGESGDLAFYTQQSGAAMTEKVRITASGFTRLTNGSTTLSMVVGTNAALNTYTSYRTTNGGSGLIPGLATYASGTAGQTVYMIDGGSFGANNGFVLGAFNSSTVVVARAGINITNLNNTAGSESGDMIFSTQSGGIAMSEKMRITGTGFVGINSTSPANTLDVIRGSAGTMGRGVYETASFSYNGDMKFGLYTSSSNSTHGAGLSFGQTNLTITANSYYPGFDHQYVYGATPAANAMRYNYTERNSGGTVVNYAANLMQVYGDGKIVFSPVASGVSTTVKVLINTSTDDAVNTLQVNGSVKATQFRLSALNTAPATASSTGTLGEIRIVNGFIYVCVATNTWQRAAIATW